jgi:hypothetical protein
MISWLWLNVLWYHSVLWYYLSHYDIIYINMIIVITIVVVVMRSFKSYHIWYMPWYTAFDPLSEITWTHHPSSRCHWQSYLSNSLPPLLPPAQRGVQDGPGMGRVAISTGKAHLGKAHFVCLACGDCFVCLACGDCYSAHAPSYFTSYKDAATHYARLPQSATHVARLPNRPSDTKAGGSGAAGSWAGQNQNCRLLQSDIAHWSGTGLAGILENFEVMTYLMTSPSHSINTVL